MYASTKKMTSKMLLVRFFYELMQFILNIAGIFRMSSVTIFKSDHFVLSTNLLLNLTFRSPSYRGASSEHGRC